MISQHVRKLKSIFEMGWHTALVLLSACALFACASAPTPTLEPRADPTSTAEPLVSFQGAAPAPTATLDPADTPEPSPTPGPLFTEYKVRAGDTLGAISERLNISLDELMKTNGLTNPHSLQIGQVLKIPTVVEKVGPAEKMVPDSEVVYGPTYKDFDVKAVAEKYGGYLASYSELVDGRERSGSEIIQLVAERFSVGPRVLLALLELQGGWVTSSVLNETQIMYPMGRIDPSHPKLYRQASWAANQLNAGYYGKISARLAVLDFTDRQRARVDWRVNPGTAAVQNVLSKTASWDEWQKLVARSGFRATYEKLFGDPFQHQFRPLRPIDLQQPTLRLPLEDGKLWYFTGGPHAGWVDGSPWAAVDFAPADQAGSCWESQYWIVAAAPGEIIFSENGRVVQDLDGDGFQGTGWALLYLHAGHTNRVEVGTTLNTNDHIGHPSCVGGDAQTSHLHFARLYNGQWISAADAKTPMVLSGWAIGGDAPEYDGTMTRGDETRSAENQRLEKINGIMPHGDQ